MTILARNEADIIEENILFHLKMGVDFFIVMDHLSNDGTTEILQRHESLGYLKRVPQTSPTYNQGVWVTQMAQVARMAYDADWVINNDADEFWMPESGTLKDFFNKIPSNVGKAHINRLDFHYRPFKDAKFYEALIFREWMCRWTKCCHRGVSDISINIGNHDALSKELSEKYPETLVNTSELRILHYPMRDCKKYKKKIEAGAQAMVITPGIPADNGFHWKQALTKIAEGTFDTSLEEKIYTQDKLMAGIKNNSIIIDCSLQKFFCENNQPM